MTTFGWITLVTLVAIVIILLWDRDYTKDQKDDLRAEYSRHTKALESCIDNLKKARSEAIRDGEQHMVDYYDAEIKETTKALYEIMERMDNL